MIVAVTGLDREARVIARPDVITVVGGGNGHSLKSQVQAALDQGAKRILSIGICGALSPALKVGDCIIATKIVADGRSFSTDPQWTRELLDRVPSAKPAVLTGSNTIVSSREAKSRLHRETGAAAVDMESHIAADIAQECRLPFAVVRIISDSHRQTLPPAALVGMSQAGKVNLPAVLRSVVAKPTQIPALLRTAWEAERAFQALFRCRHVLNPAAELGLGPADLSELSLDVS
jgi:adenosylhomocysteine nucleosidase